MSTRIEWTGNIQVHQPVREAEATPMALPPRLRREEWDAYYADHLLWMRTA